MTREEILDEAKKCVCGHREQDYGTPESNFQLIANLWRMYLGVDISATDVAMMMALVKIARIKNGGGTGDSFVDLAGYAACGGEINSSSVESPWIQDKIEDKHNVDLSCKNCRWWLEPDVVLRRCKYCYNMDEYEEYEEKKEHINTEVKRNSGRYPWGECKTPPNCLECKHHGPEFNSFCEDCEFGSKWERKEDDDASS